MTRQQYEAYLANKRAREMSQGRSENHPQQALTVEKNRERESSMPRPVSQSQTNMRVNMTGPKRYTASQTEGSDLQKRRRIEE